MLSKSFLKATKSDGFNKLSSRFPNLNQIPSFSFYPLTMNYKTKTKKVTANIAIVNHPRTFGDKISSGPRSMLVTPSLTALPSSPSSL